ncbi:lipoyl(octanoyl) transferase LipB [Minwuia sp.]|uniref:lipoyl(octanoyl) transferase LipB n=1 Tax=Minwuia sp. TaxID=2493630 RepID=UPI003A935E55
MSVEWRHSPEPVGYPDAVGWMEDRVAAIRQDRASECVWLLEHPPLYSAGTSADAADLLTPDRFPVYETGRGGEYTYHGPGQRVGYVMLDLKAREPDVRRFVRDLEAWIIHTLKAFDVTGERRDGRVGVWVVMPDGSEKKIAALGIRLRRWVSFHGISINLNPDLTHFDGIVPCGIQEHGVTSLADLGVDAGMDDLDRVLRREFDRIFT